jgi:hypothetical protein
MNEFGRCKHFVQKCVVFVVVVVFSSLLSFCSLCSSTLIELVFVFQQ